MLMGAAEATRRVGRDLEAAGHTITRCHDEGAPAFPCRAVIDGERCPLESEDVQVAVAVRLQEEPAGHSPEEDGIRCALRHRVPVVLAGAAAESPYAEWAARSCDLDHVVETVETVAESPLAQHSRAATRSFRAVLAQHDFDPVPASATVTRSGRDLKVTLSYPGDLDRRVAEMASVRVVGAIRDVDPYASKIDVDVSRS